MGREKFIFSKEQEQFLIDHWSEYTIHGFKKIFNCSWYAVNNKAQELGLVVSESRKWTYEDEEKLRELSAKYHYVKIAKMMNRSENSIYLKARKLNVKLIQDRRKWTVAEENELQDKWGNKSLEQIAAEMKRTVFSLKVKAIRMKLGPMREGALDKIRVSEISEILNVSRDVIVLNWGKVGLKLRNKKVSNKKSYLYVSLENLLFFLEENQELWDSSNLEKHILGPEPKWLVLKRKQDLIDPPIAYRKWDDEEREIAKDMLLNGFNYKEIADRIKRTDGAVRLELNRMRLGYRLKRFWKGVELKQLQELYPKKTAKELSVLLNRTPKAIQYKAAELGIKKKVLVRK